MKYYKCLTKDHTGRQSGVKWPPIGVWTPWKEIKICRSGYHICEKGLLCLWLDEKIFEVEPQTLYDFGSQCVTHRARLIKQINWSEEQARQYVIDCVKYIRRLPDWPHVHYISNPYLAARNIGSYILDIDWMSRRLSNVIK